MSCKDIDAAYSACFNIVFFRKYVIICACGDSLSEVKQIMGTCGRFNLKTEEANLS